jgi:hypothetical protein
MNTDKEKPSTTVEQLAHSIGERLMRLHPAMQIKQVDVVDGVVLVGRVGVGSISCSHNSTAE